MAMHSPGETDVFFSLAYAMQDTAYTRRHLSVLLLLTPISPLLHFLRFIMCGN